MQYNFTEKIDNLERQIQQFDFKLIEERVETWQQGIEKTLNDFKKEVSFSKEQDTSLGIRDI